MELGVQSLDPEVLRRSGRGHGPEESIKAVKALKNEDFITGVQLMPGLPGEDRKSFLSTIKQVISLKPEFVRLYPTIVIKGTPLEKLYRKGDYKPLSLARAVDLCRDGTSLLRYSGIRVIRCGLQPTVSLQREGSICAGPFHPAFGELVESALVLKQISKVIKKSRVSAQPKESIIVQSSPRHFSVLKGQKGGNQQKLNLLYPDLKVALIPDPAVPDNLIRIKYETGTIFDIPNPATW